VVGVLEVIKYQLLMNTEDEEWKTDLYLHTSTHKTRRGSYYFC
jgi:hypothetical protein